MQRWRVLTGAGALMLTGCAYGDDAGAFVVPDGTLVDVSWATTTAPATSATDVATTGDAMIPAGIVVASSVPAVTDVPSTTPPPSTVAPTVPLSAVPATTEAVAPTTVAATAPLVPATAPASTVAAAPATGALVESAEGCSLAIEASFVGSIPMRRGDHGDRVLDVQVMLDQLGFDLGRSGLDGNFGPDSENAFEQYQFAGGQTVTGIVCMEAGTRS